MKKIRIPFITILTTVAKWTALTATVATIATLTAQGAHLNGAHPIVLAIIYIGIVFTGIASVMVLSEMLDNACLRYASRTANAQKRELFKVERDGISGIIPFDYYLK